MYSTVLLWCLFFLIIFHPLFVRARFASFMLGGCWSLFLFYPCKTLNLLLVLGCRAVGDNNWVDSRSCILLGISAPCNYHARKTMFLGIIFFWLRFYARSTIEYFTNKLLPKQALLFTDRKGSYLYTWRSQQSRRS